MKGIIFTQFTEMVENEFGLSMLDEIIETSNLPSKGIYTAVGTYSHHEMVIMLSRFSELTQIPIPEALRMFGHRLFNYFFNQYPLFFEHHKHVFSFLESVEHHIHVEVLKLYPTAQLPHFRCTRIDQQIFLMEYHSDKHLEWLAIGLIEGALEQFDVTGEVKILDASDTLNGCLIQIKLQ
jgi:hypothetical protein